ncbi:MAG: hypothetical protein QG671_2829 [Actinomycetota bacterium]|nr:hypothetical protein [Actinomycetota bacterium]
MQFRQPGMRIGYAQKKRATVLLSVVGIGLASVGLAPAASAGGTSSSVYGCYTQWWNTAWAQKCSSGSPSQPGIYLSTAYCKAGFDQIVQRHRYPGESETFNGNDCSIKVTGGKIEHSWN